MAKSRRKQRGRSASAGAGGARSSATRAVPAGRTLDPPEPAAPARFAARLAASRYSVPALLFAVCLGAYVSNGDFLPGSDQEGNMLFSVNLLKRGSLSLGPLDAPHAFSWTLEQPGVAPRPVMVDNWNSAADAAYRKGQLTSPAPIYYLAATTRPDVYVNTFGLGAALLGLPVYALLDLFVEIESDRFWWWHGGALTASLLTALAAVFVFLAARGLVRPLPALLVALAFGLGSCAWPVSSQALWQHPASSFCLSLGAWLLLRSGERPRAAAWCGAALGMAVLCRPATAAAVVCVGAYLLWTDRRRCVYYVLGGLPLVVILAAYNGYYFGSPLVFGQTVASKIIALRDTGSENLWQSSWLESLPGLFISPSRGLLWFSPVLVLGLAGAVAVWREPRFRPLIPLQAAALLMILVAGRWFDWWGGSTWGYRSIVDTTPLLALLTVPLVERMIAGRGTRVLFAALLVWSVGVQFVGSWSYSAIGWLEQWREHANPDYASLWQWRRPQIGYHLANFAAERERKKQLTAAYSGNRKPILILGDRQQQGAAAEGGEFVIRDLVRDPAPFHHAAEALRKEGRDEEAIASYRAALMIDRDYAPAHAGMGAALFRLERYEESLESLGQAALLQPDPALAGSAQRLMGRAAQELGRSEAAAGHYARALQIDPLDAEALDRLARLRFGQQRYAEALERYRTLLEINPGSAQTHANRGVTLYYLGRVDEAIRSLEQALSLDPDLKTARTALERLRAIPVQGGDQAVTAASQEQVP